MYKIYTILLGTFFCLFPPQLSAQTVSPVSSNKPDYVLILSSYDITNEWAFLIVRNFSSHLQRPNKMDVVTEYLDLSPQLSLEEFQRKAAEIEKKHATRNKLIILLGEDAWIFHRTFLGQSWKQQPAIAVFSGNYTTTLTGYLSGKPITKQDIISLDDSRKGMNATILYDKIHVEPTIRLMQELLPELSSVALITDKRHISTIVEQKVKHIVQEQFPSLHFISLRMAEFSTEQLKDTIQRMDRKTGIIFHSWYQPEINSKSFQTNSMKLIIGELVHSPIFTLYDAGVKEGMITGGHYPTIGAITDKLNELSDMILAGHKASDLPVTAISETSSYLNYRNLNYLNIPPRSYPEDAIYYEKPLDNFEKNKTLIICIIIIALLLSSLFFLLVRHKHKQLLNSQRMKEILERSNQLQTTFIANMNHEVRTPLNAIVGFSGLLSEPEMLSEEERQYSLQLLTENKDTLLQLINNILDLSQIESGIMEVKKETISLKAVISDVVNVARIKHADSGIRITLAPDTPEGFIQCDWKLLTQALNTLLDKALVHSKRGEIQIGYIVQKDGIRLSIIYAGGEISEERVQYLFDSFEKEGFNAQEDGLELVLAHAIIKILGGKIGLATQTGKDFTFWFTLPSTHSTIVT